jgi:hypothetical protein
LLTSNEEFAISIKQIPFHRDFAHRHGAVHIPMNAELIFFSPPACTAGFSSEAENGQCQLHNAGYTCREIGDTSLVYDFLMLPQVGLLLPGKFHNLVHFFAEATYLSLLCEKKQTSQR